jgi:hypothetical protein
LFPPYKQREGAKHGSGRRRLSAKLAIWVVASLEKLQILVTLAPYCGTAVGAGDMARRPLPGDGVGIQVPVGHIGADRIHWQTIFDARDKPSIYRIHNASGRGAADPGNAMIVEVDSAKRTIKVNAGTSIDVMGKRIRVRAGTGGETSRVEGWYVLVS